MTKDPEVLKEALRIAYRRSLYHTAKNLCGYKDLSPKTHMRIIRALQSPSKRKIVCVPRGTFKSSVASVAYTIWLLLNNPNLRILIDSELYGNSITYLREIKAHIMSEGFMYLYGDWTTSVWNESEITISARTKILKEPSITVGGIGTTKVGQHYDVIIGDDYNSPANSGSPEQRGKVISHYQYNQSILEPDGTYVIIGTRYAEDDLIGWVLKSEIGLDSVDKLKLLPKIKNIYEVEVKDG